MEGKWDTSKKLSEVVLEYMRESNLSKQLLEHRAVSLWHVVIGPTAQRSTKKVYVKDGIMFVEMSSSVIRQELFMLKSQIINKLNESVGEKVILDVVFR